MSRKYLDQILKLCTPTQLDFFNRLYPNGLAPNQVKFAISQVEHTILSLNIEIEALKKTNKEYEELKELTRQQQASYDRELKESKEELCEAYDTINRLSAAQVNVDNARIIRQLDKLSALEQFGVDNWCGYDDAMESLNQDYGD